MQQKCDLVSAKPALFTKISNFAEYGNKEQADDNCSAKLLTRAGELSFLAMISLVCFVVCVTGQY